MRSIRRRVLLASALAGPAVVARRSSAQPIAGGRPIRLVVPFPPGGAVDLLGRLLSERMQPFLGNQIVVDNRGGAGGNIGMDNVAKSPPDGTTIGIGSTATLIANEYLYTRLPYNPRTDFSLVSRVTNGTVLCVVNARTARERGWTTFRDLIAWSKANPDKVSMGSSGVGTTSHFMISLVNERTKAGITHVPYRGGGPAITDLLAGTIDMMFDVMPALMPHVAAGRIVPLAVGSADRLAILPEVPGMKDLADLGLGDIDMQTWNGIVGPAGMPAEAVAALGDTLRRLAADAAYVERLAPLGYTALADASPAAFAAVIEAERPRWEAIVKLSGARVE
jgi:tripartite-type tricarboxylate transporter receptor subunit TctC